MQKNYLKCLQMDLIQKQVKCSPMVIAVINQML